MCVKMDSVWAKTYAHTVELAGGLWANSFAVLSDALHDLGRRRARDRLC